MKRFGMLLFAFFILAQCTKNVSKKMFPVNIDLRPEVGIMKDAYIYTTYLCEAIPKQLKSNFLIQLYTQNKEVESILGINFKSQGEQKEIFLGDLKTKTEEEILKLLNTENSVFRLKSIRKFQHNFYEFELTLQYKSGYPQDLPLLTMSIHNLLKQNIAREVDSFFFIYGHEGDDTLTENYQPACFPHLFQYK